MAEEVTDSNKKEMDSNKKEIKESFSVQIIRNEKMDIVGARAEGDTKDGDVRNTLLMAFIEDVKVSVNDLNESSNKLEYWTIGLFILTIILCILTFALIVLTSKLLT